MDSLAGDGLIQEDIDHSTASICRAWAVHLFTASGVIWAFLSLDAIISGRISDAYLWMLIAVIVDATDGVLARACRVKDVLPHIDGALLDNIVDYLNWTFIPVVFFFYSGWLMEPKWLFSACILLSSAFAFVHSGAKSVELGFFRGFPSYWNIGVFFTDISLRQFDVVVGPSGSPIITSIVILFCLLSVLPIYFIYPSRAVRWANFFKIGSLIWTIQIGLLVVYFPTIPSWLYLSSLIFPAAYLCISFAWTPSVIRQLKSRP
ncbi:MAG: hypothetical protein CMH52_05670 [Myxococcales bacterium]|nr:hypothetical protein [Myxococcales bacterium]